MDGQAVAQVGSTVGSTSGNVNITAGSNATVTGSNVISGQNTTITAQNVTIDAATNTSQTKQTYEFKQSGLTVSLGGGVVAAGTNLAYDIRRAGEVSDSRLKALYEYKAFKELEKLNGQFNGDWQNSVSINISLGSTRYSSQSVTTATSAQGSNLTAGGDVSIAATGSGAKDASGKAADGSVTVAGSTVSGTNVNLTAAKDINLEAADNTSTSNTTSSGSSAGVGVQIGPSGGIYVQGSKSIGTENEAATTRTQAVVAAQNTLTTASGSDTNIVGGQAKGGTVNMTVGGSLNIASRQDTETYSSRTSSAGGTVGLGTGVGSTISASKGKTESTYASVTEQSGVYAGTGGFDIYVGGNTDLKGAVIASEATPDKNRISTGTLTWSDIQNKAEYKASSSGISLSTEIIKPDGKFNYEGNNAYKAGTDGSAAGTTRSAVAPGTIEIKNSEGQTQDVNGLRRDTQNANGSITPIFDKEKVQEELEFQQALTEEIAKEIAKQQKEKKKITGEQDIKNQSDIIAGRPVTLIDPEGRKIVIEPDSQIGSEQANAILDDVGRIIGDFDSSMIQNAVIVLAGAVVIVYLENGVYNLKVQGGGNKVVKSVDDLAGNIKNWVGSDARYIKNSRGDTVIISSDGTRRVRFDINNTFPHQNPHGHVEELINGKWVRSGPIYPRDVEPK